MRERDRLMREVPGLVTPQPIVLPTRTDDRLGRWTYATGLLISL